MGDGDFSLRTEEIASKSNSNPKSFDEVNFIRLDPSLPKKLERLGAPKLPRCYNCGTCTATCPLSKERSEFPRLLIRYAVLGAEERLLSSFRLWLCYYCGDCAETCPREADPGSIMMAARRYAIMKNSPGGLGFMFYESLKTCVSALLVLTFFIFSGIYFLKGPAVKPVSLPSFLSFELIHKVGILFFVFLTLSFLISLISFMRGVLGSSKGVSLKNKVYSWLSALIPTIKESLIQLNLLKCGNRFRYLAHLSVFWGWIGLFVASITNLVMFGVEKSPLYPVPPSRILGVLSGLFFLFGTVYFIYKRIKKDEESVKFSHFSDWLFIVLLLLSSISGFMLTLSLYLNLTSFSYIMFVLHLLVVADLLILMPFTKFAHSFYRPLAIWANNALLKMSDVEEVV